MSDLNPPIFLDQPAPINPVIVSTPAAEAQPSVVEADRAAKEYSDVRSIGGKDFKFNFPIPGILVFDLLSAKSQGDVYRVYHDIIFTVADDPDALRDTLVNARPVIEFSEIEELVNWISNKAAGRPLGS